MIATNTPLKILALEAENILRLVAINIKPDGSVIELTGRNRQGKSSIIHSIWMALGGEKQIPARPIRDGADAAIIKVDLGDGAGNLVYRVTRKFKRKDDEFPSTLTIETAEGAKFQNPQKLLNTIIGAFSFDPMAFLDRTPQEQAETFRQFVKGFDFAAAEKANETDFKERTTVNRDAKNARAREAGVVVPEGAPAAAVDVSELIVELERAGEHNANIEKRRAARQEAGRTIDRLKASSTDLAARAGELRRQADLLLAQSGRAADEAAEWQAKLDKAEELPEPIDASSVSARIQDARRNNTAFEAAARAGNEKARHGEEAAASEAKSAALTKAIDDRKATMQAAIAASEMPVADITFADDGSVLYRSLPINQASQAEQIAIGVQVAAALNPRLRFVSIKQASLLDEDSWAFLARLAEEKDLQIIAETVQSNRPTAVVIEDGMVARQPVSAAA